MSKRAVLWVGVYVAAVAVLIAGVVPLVRQGNGKVTAAAVPGKQAVMPFPTAIDVGRSTVSVGDVTTVSVGGTSTKGITTIGLYDGGRRVSTVTPPKGQMISQLAYPALAVGPHALHAAVTDGDGRVALTPIVNVDVRVGAVPAAPVAMSKGKTPPTEPAAGTGPIEVPVTVEAGETVKQLAERLGVVPAQVQLSPASSGKKLPTLPEDVKLPTGAVVMVAVQPDAGMAKLISDKPIVQQVATPATTAFTLTASARGCAISLTPANASGSVDYFEAGPAGVGWTSVGSGRKSADFDLRQTAPGAHVYMARSGDAQTTPVSVLMPFSCAENVGWTGNARIDNGILTIDPAVLDYGPASGYMGVYLQVDGATAQRLHDIPRSASADLAGKLPRLSGRKLDVEVFTGGDHPVSMAKGSLRVPDGMSMSDVVGFATRGSFDLRDPKGAKGSSWNQGLRAVTLAHDDLSLTFDWTSDAPGVTEALWQVVRFDNSGVHETVASGSGVLAGGVSEGTSTSDGGSGGSFTIDTSKIPGHESVALRRQEVDQNKPITPQPTAPQIGTVTSAFQPGELTALGPVNYAKLSTGKAATTAAQTMSAADQSWQPLPMPGDTLAVQVLLNPNGPAPGPWLDSFRVALPTPQPVENPDTGVTFGPGTLEIDPGLAPDPGYNRCGVVTVPLVQPVLPKDQIPEEPQAAAMVRSTYDVSWLVMNKKYPQGSGVYCMPPPKPPKTTSCSFASIPLPQKACDATDVIWDVLGQYWEAAKGMYDTITTIYNTAIKVAVQLVSEANPLCIALKKADPKVGSGCVTAFAAAGQTAITIVLGSVGLPPSLPTLADLEAIAEGDLAKLGREILGQLIPCDAITMDPELQGPIADLGEAAGSPEAAAAVNDGCLALLQVMISQTKAQIVSAMSANTATSTGLPPFPTIPGFSITPDPRTQQVPPTIRYTASPAKFDAQALGAKCQVAIRRGPQSSSPLAFLGVTPLLEADPIDGKGPFAGGMNMPFTTWSNMSPNLLPGATMTFEAWVEGQCHGGEVKGTATVPKLPR